MNETEFQLKLSKKNINEEMKYRCRDCTADSANCNYGTTAARAVHSRKKKKVVKNRLFEI